MREDYTVWRNLPSGVQTSFVVHAGKLLVTLQRHPDMSIASLAEAVGINKSAMQKLLKSMTSKGYIIRNDADNTWHVLAISTE